MSAIKIQWQLNSLEWEELILNDPPTLNSRIPDPDNPIPDGGLWSYTFSFQLSNGLAELLDYNPQKPKTFKKRRIPILFQIDFQEIEAFLYIDKILYDNPIPSAEGTVTIKTDFWELLNEAIIQDPPVDGRLPDKRTIELRDLTDLSINVKDTLKDIWGEGESIKAIIALFSTIEWAKVALLFRGTYNLSYPFQDKNLATPYAVIIENGETVPPAIKYFKEEGTAFTLTEIEICPKVDSVIQALCNYFGIDYLSIGELSQFPNAHMTPPLIQQWPNIWYVNYNWIPTAAIGPSWISTADPRSQLNVNYGRFDNYSRYMDSWAVDIAEANLDVTFPWIYFQDDQRKAAFDLNQESYLYYFCREGNKGQMKLRPVLPPSGNHWCFITISTGLSSGPVTKPERWWIQPVANALEYTFDYELFEDEYLRVSILEEQPGNWLPQHKFDFELIPTHYWVEDNSLPLNYRWDTITDEYYRVKLTNFNGVKSLDLLKDLFLCQRKPPYFINGNLSCTPLTPKESIIIPSEDPISLEPVTDKKLWISKKDDDRLDPLRFENKNTPLTEELTWIAPAFKQVFGLSRWLPLSTGFEKANFEFVSISNKDNWTDRIEVDGEEIGYYPPFSYNKLYKTNDKVRFQGRYYSLGIPELQTTPDVYLTGKLYTTAPMPNKIWSLYRRYRGGGDFLGPYWEPIDGNPWIEEVVSINTTREYLNSIKLITIESIPDANADALPFDPTAPFAEGYYRLHPFNREIQEEDNVWVSNEWRFGYFRVPKTEPWGGRIETNPVNWPGWIDQTYENVLDKNFRLDAEPQYEWIAKLTGKEFLESSIRPIYIRYKDDLYILTELTEWDTLTNIARIKARRLWD